MTEEDSDESYEQRPQWAKAGERVGRGWQKNKTADKIITMRGPSTFADEKTVWQRENEKHGMETHCLVCISVGVLREGFL